MANEAADRIYRLGADIVNWYLVEDGGRFTVVDAGLPKQYEQLPSALAKLGHTMNDVEAVLLTHAHSDHIGSAAQIKSVSGASVHVHRADAALARANANSDNERSYVRDMYHPHLWKVFAFLIRNGVLKTPPVHEVAEFGHGDVLDIPGRPRVIHTPGHTDGSACLEIADRGAIFTGDALVTLSMVNGERNPRIMPRSFNNDSKRALESLNELAGSEAELVLPGHGEPWHGSVAAAVTLAQQTGPN